MELAVKGNTEPLLGPTLTVLPMLNYPPADPLVPIRYRNSVKCQLDALAHAGREIPRLGKRTKQARRVGMRPASNDIMNIEIFC